MTKRASDFAFFASEHMRTKIDPHGSLPVLTYEEVDIVVKRIYERLQEEILNKKKKALKACLVLLVLFSSSASAEIPNHEVPQLVEKIIQAESSGRHHLSGDRDASRGLMQIQKSVWKTYTREPWHKAFDPALNQKVGTQHVEAIIKRYGKRATPALVIYTYNTGRFVKPHQKLPSWTRNHPNNVYRKIFRVSHE